MRRPGGWRMAAERIGLCTALALAPAASAQSDPATARPSRDSGRIGVARPSGGELCVEVEVGGYRSGHLDCATHRLRQAMRDAQARAPNAGRLGVPDARSADLVTGVASRTATRQRMGSNFGVSVRPQRPPPPQYQSPLRRP
jgi:hypothetical protein